jgi:hypothetical protein
MLGIASMTEQPHSDFAASADAIRSGRLTLRRNNPRRE